MVWHKSKIVYLFSAASILILVFIIVFSFLKITKVIKETGDGDRAEYKNIEIGGMNIIGETVSNPDDWYRGLSNRENLCAGCGMLFIFPDRQKREFVMRNMKFPLDIVFIDNNKIINIASDLPPEGANPVNVYTSAAAANYVLELPAGFCRKNGVVAGDIIKINE